MKRLECPIGDCTSVFEEETEDELMSEVAAHAEEHHPDVEMDERTTNELRSSIQTV